MAIVTSTTILAFSAVPYLKLWLVTCSFLPGWLQLVLWNLSLARQSRRNSLTKIADGGRVTDLLTASDLPALDVFANDSIEALLEVRRTHRHFSVAGLAFDKWVHRICSCS